MQSSLFEHDAIAKAIEQLHAATSFYTAEPIVAKLLDAVGWPQPGARLADTAAGDGAFLSVALDRLLSARPSLADEQILEQVQGWEIHPGAAAEARARLASVLASHGRGASAVVVAEQMVINADFLERGPTSPCFDVVVGNPPFLRSQHLPPLLRERYLAVVPEYSRADMLHSFLDRCASLLRPEGQIALVSSDRWLFTRNAATLRAVIGQRLGLHHLERLDCSSSFYRPKNRRAGQPPRVHPVAFVLRELSAGVRPLSASPIYPGSDAMDAESVRTLADVSSVRLAPWLGPDGIFVLSRDEAALRGLPQDVLVPAVGTGDLRTGLTGTTAKVAIRTLRAVEPPASVMAHLDAQLHLMPASKRRTARRWVPPESFEGIHLDRPCLVLPRIANSLRPVRVPAGVLPLDHAVMIAPADGQSLESIEAVLTSERALTWVRARAPRVEGGYFTITSTLIKALPFE